MLKARPNKAREVLKNLAQKFWYYEMLIVENMWCIVIKSS